MTVATAAPIRYILPGLPPGPAGRVLHEAVIVMTSPGSQNGVPRWEHFPHGADIGVRGFGASPAAAFEQAALALTAAVTSAKVEPSDPVELRCEAPDFELLFVEWLNGVIYEMAIRRMLFGRFAVRVEGGRLEGTLWGEPVDVRRHAPACEPKGATYAELRVEADDRGVWSAGCVVDV